MIDIIESIGCGHIEIDIGTILCGDIAIEYLEGDGTIRIERPRIT